MPKLNGAKHPLQVPDLLSIALKGCFFPTLSLVLLCGTNTASEIKLSKASLWIYSQKLQQSVNLASEPAWSYQNGKDLVKQLTSPLQLHL